MKVCVEKKEKEKGKIEFPSLVEGDNGLVVLAVIGDDKEFSGMVLVKGNSHYHVGEASDNWDTTSFTPFDSSITISNK